MRNWLRNRNTIELLGFWEILNNPDFKPVEFDGFRKGKIIIRSDVKLTRYACYPLSQNFKTEGSTATSVNRKNSYICLN
nr:hypothetical protein [Parapedobacter indicus]